MPSSTIYNQGDVVFIPFPFTNLQTNKQRPALVISSNWYNQSRADVILVSITSQIPQIPDRDQVILTTADLRMANLNVPCVVRTGKIFTIEKTKIIKTLGRVSPGTITNAIQNLCDVISGT